MRSTSSNVLRSPGQPRVTVVSRHQAAQERPKPSWPRLYDLLGGEASGNAARRAATFCRATRELGSPIIFVIFKVEVMRLTRPASRSRLLRVVSARLSADFVMRRRSFSAMSLSVGFFGTARIGSGGTPVPGLRPTPDGGVSVQENVGGNDQSPAPKKLTVPPQKLALT
jgi:hypothetical protein